MPRTTKWILVADAARARIFEVDTKERTMVRTPIWEMTADTLASRDIASDRPGRTFDSAGTGRHAMEPPTDPHRHEKRQFAREIAGMLEEQRKKGAVDQLVVVAPPQMLGDLRAEASGELTKLVGVEIAKDLSMLPPHEIEEHLKGVIRP